MAIPRLLKLERTTSPPLSLGVEKYAFLGGKLPFLEGGAQPLSGWSGPPSPSPLSEWSGWLARRAAAGKWFGDMVRREASWRWPVTPPRSGMKVDGGVAAQRREIRNRRWLFASPRSGVEVSRRGGGAVSRRAAA